MWSCCYLTPKIDVPFQEWNWQNFATSSPRLAAAWWIRLRRCVSPLRQNCTFGCIWNYRGLDELATIRTQKMVALRNKTCHQQQGNDDDTTNKKFEAQILMQSPTVRSECPTKMLCFEEMKRFDSCKTQPLWAKQIKHFKEEESSPKVLQLNRDNHIETDIWSRRRPMKMSEEDSVCTSNRKSKDPINTKGTRRNFRGTIK